MSRSRSRSAAVIAVCLSVLSFQAAAEVMMTAPRNAFAVNGPRSDFEALAKGQQALRARHFDEAEQAFGEAYKINPRSVEAMLGLAAAAQGVGKSKLARDWMSSAVAMAPGQPSVLQAQARLLTEMGLFSDAEESYKAAIASHPGLPQLKVDLASLYLDKLKKPAEAIAILREVIRQSPDTPAAYLGLGLALSADGRIDEASRVLDEAVRRDPSNPFALHAQGLVALRLDQADRALASFDKALTIRRDFAGATIGRGDALLALGRGEQALEAYSRAATLAPTSAYPHALRAQAFEKMRRLPEAEAAYRDALRIDPNDLRIMNNLAYVLASQRTKLDEALNLIQRAITKGPNRAALYDTLGVVQLARNNVPAAREAFERGLALEPGNLTLRQHNAQIGVAPQTTAARPAATTVASTAAPVAAAPATPVTVAAAARPTAAAVPAAARAPATAEADPTKLVGGRLEAWRQAWEAKDVARYLGFYSKDFTPADKRARSAWEADRRLKLAKKGDIHVQVSAPSFKREGNAVLVTYEQRYQSGNYSDAGRKQLEWVNEGGDWKIRREAQL